jgi:hypothetical protein
MRDTMRSASTPSQTVARLTSYLLDDRMDDPLAVELTAWMTDSPRFRGFADAHRDKIRKKLRGATDGEARRDVRSELRVAQLLHNDRRMAVAFEAYGTGNPGPDFTVTRGGDRFNLEVTRPRGTPQTAGFGALLAKLRQLPPAIPNVVLLAIDGRDAAAYDVAEAIRALRARADAKDEALFTSRGFAGTRAFYERFLRLGAVITWAEQADGEARAAAWTNPSSRTPMPPRAAHAVLAALRAPS